MPQTSNAWLHYRYWIGILIAVAIGLAALAFAKVQDVGTYLNFALTIGSLLLSGLAIVYAFVSNGSLAQNLGALDNASRAVVESAATVQTVTARLSEQVETIPKELSSMGAKMETLAMLAAPKQSTETPTPGSAAGADPSTLLTQSPFAGMIMIYALTTAHALAKPIDLEAMSALEGIPLPSMFPWGFTSALNAADYIELADGSRLNHVVVTSVPAVWTPGSVRDAIDVDLQRDTTLTEGFGRRVRLSLASVDRQLDQAASAGAQSKASVAENEIAHPGAVINPVPLAAAPSE